MNVDLNSFNACSILFERQWIERKRWRLENCFDIAEEHSRMTNKNKQKIIRIDLYEQRQKIINLNGMYFLLKTKGFETFLSLDTHLKAEQRAFSHSPHTVLHFYHFYTAGFALALLLVRKVYSIM